jgi:hypothetical protein
VVSVGAGQAGSSNITASFQPHLFEAPMPEHLMMMRLETHATALQKKENEAFLSVFATPPQSASVLSLANAVEPAPDSTSTLAPCANLDARTVDAAILLLGATFTHQSVEYQDKAVQLCAQAVVEFGLLILSKTIVGGVHSCRCLLRWLVLGIPALPYCAGACNSKKRQTGYVLPTKEGPAITVVNHPPHTRTPVL